MTNARRTDDRTGHKVTIDGRGALVRAGLVLAALSILLAGPLAGSAAAETGEPVAAAQADTGIDPVILQAEDLCEETNIDGIIASFLEITMLLGLIAAIVIWQADTVVSILSLNAHQKRKVKEHKRSALKAAVVLLMFGPAVTIFGQTAGLPFFGDGCDMTLWGFFGTMVV